MFVLRDLDLFKAIPETRFKGQKGGHSSMFGRTLTLCLICSSTALLIYFSLDMLMRTNPRIETFNAISDSDLILNNETFPFAFAMRDINGNFYIDENIYTVGAYFAVSGKNITLTRCKPTMFPGTYDPEKEIAIFCFSDKQNFTNIGINGKGGLVINFEKCNKNKNPNCRDESEIDEIIYKSRVRILYHDVSISPSNYENPMQEIVRAWDPSVCRTIVKQNAMFLSQNYFTSDNGWLFPSVKNTSKITFDDRLQYFEDNEIMGNVFNVIYVRTYGQIRYTQRVYDNIPSILPRWNAIFTLLLIFGKILSDSYNKFKTQETLVQDIFFLKQRRFRREKTRMPSKSSFGSQTRIERMKETTSSPLCSPLETERELIPRRSIEYSPVIMHKKVKSTEMRAFSALKFKVPDEQNVVEERKPLTKPKQARNTDHRRGTTGLSLDGLPSRIDVVQKPVMNQQTLQSKLNFCDIEVDLDFKKESYSAEPKLNTSDLEADLDVKKDLNSVNSVEPKPNLCDIEVGLDLKKGLNSIEPSPSQDLEDISPQKVSEPKKERIKRDLFKDGSDVNFCAWLISSIKKTEHYKVHLKRESIIQEEFDFQNYAKRFIGIDVLKYILLSKDQLKVFDNCVKAYVNLKLDALTRGSATDDEMFDELRTMFNTKGFSAEAEDNALLRMKEIPDPDETTKKIIYLLEVLYER